MTSPPNGLGPGRCGRPQVSAKARVRTLALWPQNELSEPAHQAKPVQATRPYRRVANCRVRAKIVWPLMIIGMVWIRPAPGWRSMASARRTMASPVIRLSASSTSMCS